MPSPEGGRSRLQSRTVKETSMMAEMESERGVFIPCEMREEERMT
jgi:hypothetical protein